MDQAPPILHAVCSLTGQAWHISPALTMLPGGSGTHAQLHDGKAAGGLGEELGGADSVSC